MVLQATITVTSKSNASDIELLCNKHLVIHSAKDFSTFCVILSELDLY